MVEFKDREKKHRVAILMTCYNRADLTERCIDSLQNSCDSQNTYLTDFYVVNDGCTDNTKNILDKRKNVYQLQGNGELYWNGGMHLAFYTAVQKKYDFYLWVNDDVCFYDGIIGKMLEQYEQSNLSKCILTGYTVGLDGKTITYGGQRLKKGIIPLNLVNILPDGKNTICDSMHGNCVLIPQNVVNEIGIIDPYYTHGFGDVDYGLRATKAGIPIYMTEFCVGVCEKNPRSNRKNVYKDKKLVERFKIMNSWRQRPIKDWLHFTKKFGGPLWFLRFVAPYIKLVVNKYD